MAIRISGVILPANKHIRIALRSVYGIGSHRALEICKKVGVEPSINYLSARNEVLHAYSDHTKAHKVFGDPTGISLAEGISRMAAWAKKVGARQSKEFANIEITEKLPDGWQIPAKQMAK